MALHPHHFTLNLLKSVLDGAPKLFSLERREAMTKEYQALLANQQVGQTEIEEKIVEFGKEIWPYRLAFEKIHNRYGHGKEEEMALAALPPEMQNKFQAFVKDGGCLEDFRKGTVLEQTFTPEEKFILGQTVINIRHRVNVELKTACQKEKATEFNELLEENKKTLVRLNDKINILKGLAGQSPKWEAEIKERVRAFEESFSFIEKSYGEEDIDNAVDYYRGVIEETETS
ncbi:MAG: hypothetical protein Q8M83_03265 [bacterium]|nr:hypothetical protein [bacterium]